MMTTIQDGRRMPFRELGIKFSNVGDDDEGDSLSPHDDSHPYDRGRVSGLLDDHERQPPPVRRGGKRIHQANFVEFEPAQNRFVLAAHSVSNVNHSTTAVAAGGVSRGPAPGIDSESSSERPKKSPLPPESHSGQSSPKPVKSRQHNSRALPKRPSTASELPASRPFEAPQVMPHKPPPLTSPIRRPLPEHPQAPRPASRSLSPGGSSVSAPTTPKPTLQTLQIPLSPANTAPIFHHPQLNTASSTTTPSTASTWSAASTDTVITPSPPPSSRHNHSHRRDIFSLSNALPLNRGLRPEDESIPISPADDSITVSSLYGSGSPYDLPWSSGDDKASMVGSISGQHPSELFCSFDEEALVIEDPLEERRGRRERSTISSSSSTASTLKPDVTSFPSLDPGHSNRPEDYDDDDDDVDTNRPQTLASNGYIGTPHPHTPAVGVLGPINVKDLARVPDVPTDGDAVADNSSLRSLSPIRYATPGEYDLDDITHSPSKSSNRWPYDDEDEETDEELLVPHSHPVRRRSISLEMTTPGPSLTPTRIPSTAPVACAPTPRMATSSVPPTSTQRLVSLPASISRSTKRHPSVPTVASRSTPPPPNQRRTNNVTINVGITAGKDGLSLCSPPSTVTTFGHGSNGAVVGRKSSVPARSRSPSSRVVVASRAGGTKVPIASGNANKRVVHPASPLPPPPSSAPHGLSQPPPSAMSTPLPTYSTIGESKPLTHARKSLSVDSPQVPRQKDQPQLPQQLHPAATPSQSPSTSAVSPQSANQHHHHTSVPTIPTIVMTSAPSAAGAIVGPSRKPNTSSASIHPPSPTPLQQQPLATSAASLGVPPSHPKVLPRPGGGVTSHRIQIASSPATAVVANRRSRGGAKQIPSVTWTRPTVFHSPPRS